MTYKYCSFIPKIFFVVVKIRFSYLKTKKKKKGKALVAGPL